MCEEPLMFFLIYFGLSLYHSCAYVSNVAFLIAYWRIWRCTLDKLKDLLIELQVLFVLEAVTAQ